MSAPDTLEPAALLERLREPLDGAGNGQAGEEMYEAWVSRESWRLQSEALPLLVGHAPEQWPAFLARYELAEYAASLAEVMASDLGLSTAAPIGAASLRHWTRSRKLTMPPELERLLDFVVHVMPAAVPNAEQSEMALARASDRELVLGAALALVTRFAAQCRDNNGFFDGGQIADLMLSQAARWFPLQAPSLDRDQIRDLLETYLSG